MATLLLIELSGLSRLYLSTSHAQVTASHIGNQSNIYQYDSKTGRCMNHLGQEGWNKINLATLFDGINERLLADPTFQPKHRYRNINAECVDFRGFDFNRVIKLSYVTLEKWNLQGANLDHASFTFAHMINSDLRGARLSKISMGYANIDGVVDPFTQYPDFCKRMYHRSDPHVGRINCEL